MSGRELALVAYRLLALWIGASGLMLLSDTLLNWESIATQSQGPMAGVSNPITGKTLFWMMTSALAARALFGALPWWAAPTLARHTPFSEPSVARQQPSREALYSAAAFLVGIWLLSSSIPGLVFVAYAATRPGVPAYDDGLGGARVAQLLVELIFGVAFVRGGWLVDVAIWSRGGPDATSDTRGV